MIVLPSYLHTLRKLSRGKPRKLGIPNMTPNTISKRCVVRTNLLALRQDDSNVKVETGNFFVNEERVIFCESGDGRGNQNGLRCRGGKTPKDGTNYFRNHHNTWRRTPRGKGGESRMMTKTKLKGITGLRNRK